MRRFGSLMVIALCVGCADTGRDEVVFPLYVAGTDVADAVVAANDVPVVLERADLAFGPLYFCAGFQAGHLCDTARVEWLGSAVVLAMSSEARYGGAASGVSGRVNSWMYDLGLTSLLTEEDPLVMPAADALGGVSLRLEGTADVDGVFVPFAANVVVSQTEGTERGVPVVRKNADDDFGHDLTPDEQGLLVRFDPRPWIRGVDFGAFVEDGVCQACGERLLIDPESQAYRAIHNALVAGERPFFEWGFSP